MTEKIYDPQYETNVPHFNKTIACEWVRNHNNEKIKHWLDNGKPHKRIVSEALYSCGYFNNLEALALIYNSGWLKKSEVLRVALSNYSSKEAVDEKYLWIIDKIFNETDKNVKSKRKSFIYQLYTMAISKEKALVEGVDFKIKEAIDDLNDMFRQATSGLHQYRLHKDESNIKRAINGLEKALIYIKNGTPFNIIHFIDLMKYSEDEPVKTFINEIVKLDRMYFKEDVIPSLFLTELPMWKRFSHIDEVQHVALVKLFKNSGIKETILLNNEAFKENNDLLNYFEDRRYIIGSVCIINTEINKRINEPFLRTTLKGEILPFEMTLNIAEYVFIENNKDNYTKEIKECEKEKSHKEYEMI